MTLTPRLLLGVGRCSVGGEGGEGAGPGLAALLACFSPLACRRLGARRNQALVEGGKKTLHELMGVLGGAGQGKSKAKVRQGRAGHFWRASPSHFNRCFE